MLQGLCTDVGIKSKPVALNLPRQDDKLHQDEDDHVGDHDDDGGDLDSKNGDNYDDSSGSVFFLLIRLNRSRGEDISLRSILSLLSRFIAGEPCFIFSSNCPIPCMVGNTSSHDQGPGKLNLKMSYSILHLLGE